MDLVQDFEHRALLVLRHPQGAEYGGPPRMTTATGRSRCRRCGRKILRGDSAVQWCHDFGGCGSWTATIAYVHAFDCGGPC